MSLLHGSAVGMVLTLCILQSVAADAQPARRLLASEDLYRIQDVSDPQVSPDGRWVAYVVTTSDREADAAQSAIWMTSWDGRQRLALTRATADIAKPRWSPDGRYLAFLTAAIGTDTPQVMLLDRRGGEPQQITHVSGIIGDYAFAPDGKRLVLTMDPADEEKTPKPIVMDALHFKDDAGGYIRAGHARHLYLFDVESKHLDALTQDPGFNEDRPAWSPDGRSIAFTRTRGSGPDPDGREDIDVIDAQVGGNIRTVARPFAPNAQALAFSPDGSTLAYLQGLEPKYYAYQQDRLFVVPAMGGTPRSPTELLDRAIASYVFSDDSKSVTLVVEDDGIAYAAHLDLASGVIAREATTGKFVASSLTSGGGHIGLIESSDQALAEVYALEDGRLRRLTAHNEALLAELTLGNVEDIHYASKDGTEIHGLVVKPPGFMPGKRYPLILWIHGGPNGGDQHALILDGYQFEHQMFAAKGYVVLRINYRGGSGRGIKFAKAIFADWGHKEVEDLLARVDYAVAQGWADKDRLAIGGWSYGGILTDYAIATDRRFKVAISGAGSGNQLSTYGTDEYVLQYNQELGPPWRATAQWLKLSFPFFHADRIHTPTLFVGGSKDFNVPISGGEQMYQALKTLGVPATLVVYPGEHHVFTRPSFVKDLADRMSARLDLYISTTH